MLNVFDPHVNPFFNISVPDYLMDNHTNGRFGDVVDDTGTAMIEFVRHALLYGTVGFDVNDIADFVGFEICGKLYRPMFTEIPREHVARARADTE